jgi:hypothetical protein
MENRAVAGPERLENPLDRRDARLGPGNMDRCSGEDEIVLHVNDQQGHIVGLHDKSLHHL